MLNLGTNRRARWIALLVFLGALLGRAAEAQAGDFELRAADSGPLELRDVGDGFEGRFTITNLGTDPLLPRLELLGTGDAAPRTPPGVQLAMDDATTPIAPGAARGVKVRWRPEESSRARELYGQVIVTADSARPQALGLHAERGLLAAHILSLLTFLPLLGPLGIVLARVARVNGNELPRRLTIALAAVNLALAAWLYAAFDPRFTRAGGNDGYQFVERAAWIPSLGVEYSLGVDGLSIAMVFLTALIAFVGALASRTIREQREGYYAMYGLLTTGMFGVFVALDLFLFYVFWEVMLLPMYFLIGVWGGPRRQYAAIKFFLYTLAGSVFLLLAFLWLYLNSDPVYLASGALAPRSFALPELARVGWAGKGLTLFGLDAVKVVWVWLFLAFAIKIPMFPFHTWLPDAHVEAPTAISVILAGVLLKMGTYGLLRINFGLLPEATGWAATAMGAFGVVNILYGALCAMAQRDLKKLVAYSSVSHMGFALLALGALSPQGIQACLVQMFNHGLITAMLFTLVGVVYERAHTRDIDRFGGLAAEMPVYTAFVGFAFMASLGLPGLSGFWGEALTLLGAFPRYRVLTLLAATGLILSAAYHLWALQRVFLGPFRDAWRTSHELAPFGGRFPEIDRREILTLAPLAALVLVLGFWPRPLFDVIDRGALEAHRGMGRPGATAVAAER